ncbi:MAG TPA: hypothetical protein VLY46_01570 [Usitatibacter sp.]|nr:hypothetical protein [Usitatibacter sp.]
MNLLLLAFALALAAAPLAVQAAAPGEAGEKTLRLAPKEAIVSSGPVFVSPAGIASAQLHAPFLMSDEDPAHLDFEPHPESRRGRPWSCHGDKTLCYDPSTGHIVYKPIRKFMPDIPGLQREDISLNRRRILFKYSF